MNKNKFLYKMCEGCADYGGVTIIKSKPDLELYNRKCRIEYPVLPNCQCPCITCLVKGMCDNSCEEFEEYINKSKEAGAKAYNEQK